MENKYRLLPYNDICPCGEDLSLCPVSFDEDGIEVFTCKNCGAIYE